MREHLQTRHQEMTNDIVEFIEESTNVIGNQFNSQNEWLDEILCQIYKQAGATSCTGDRKSILGMAIEWPEDHAPLSDQLKRLHDSLQDVKRTLSVSNDESDNSSTSNVGSTSSIINEKIGAFEHTIKGNMSGLEVKLDALEVKMKKELKTIDGALKAKMDALEVKMKEELAGMTNDMKGMMSKMMDVLVKKE